MTINIDDVTFKGLKDATPLAPMSQEESRVFMNCGLKEMHTPGDEVYDEKLLEDCLRHPSFATIVHRLEHAGIDWQKVVSFGAMMFVATLDTMDRFGNAVLWAYTLLYLSADEKERITIELLAQHFPVGFPSQEAISKVWGSQKGHAMGDDDVDNFIDKPDWWHDLVEIRTGTRPAVTEDPIPMV